MREISRMECLDKCRLNDNGITLEMLADIKSRKTAIKILNAQSKGVHYRLEYSPVGNNIQNPTVIICGITPDNDTWNLFRKSLINGDSLEKAARESVYSNMRDRLFKCLLKIYLFDYLADKHEYWQLVRDSEDGQKNNWSKIFSSRSASKECGLQLTQACNCAILRGTSSKQPTKSALNEIVRIEPKCLFNRFSINSSLKLIIFLGTTRDLERFWRDSCYYDKRIKVLSIPHPSGSNRVYNNDDAFRPLSEQDTTQLRNAKNLIINAKRVINDLKKGEHNKLRVNG